MINITPKILRKFTNEEVAAISKLGWKESNNVEYPLLSNRDKGNYDRAIYKLDEGYLLDIVDKQTGEIKQNVYTTLNKLLNKIKKY
jgi:hypothetical protein